MTSFLTISGENRARYEVRRSVFICTVKGIESFAQGTEFCQTVAKEFSDASHNCYALLTKDGRQKFSDGGEPQGTAGTPILQVLKNKNLTDVAAVVTRYFGGVKLGAGGLAAAYSDSVKLALNSSDIITKKFSRTGKLSLTYEELGKVSVALAQNAMILDTVYGDGVEIKFAVPINNWESVAQKISAATAGTKEIVPQESGYFVYP